MDQTAPQPAPPSAPRNPTPARRRYFGHREVVIDGVRYEIHPGPSLSRGLIVYQRTKAGLRRVKNPGVVRAVIREFERQHDRATELQAELARKEKERKPATIRNERFWQRWWRLLRAWWARKRSERQARRAARRQS